ncbi:hypothetical protein [Streptomyces sp. NPDC003487]
MTFRSRVIVTSAAALCSLTLVSCTGSGHAHRPSPSTPSGTVADTAGPPGRRAERIEGETVTAAPKLPSGEPLAQVAAVKGNRRIGLGTVAARPLGVVVNCQGKGTLTVQVQPVNLSFTLACTPGEVSGTYNEVRLSRTHPDATVSVTAPSSVSWSLAVGQ